MNKLYKNQIQCVPKLEPLELTHMFFLIRAQISLLTHMEFLSSRTDAICGEKHTHLMLWPSNSGITFVLANAQCLLRKDQ